MTELTGIRLTAAAVALAGCLTSAEYLFALRHRAFSETTLFSWDVCKARPGFRAHRWPVRVLDVGFAPRIFTALLLLRIIASVLLLYLPSSRALLVTICVMLALFSGLLVLRHEHGRDGADQMLLILYVGLAVYFLFAPDSPWRWLGLAFIATQSVLAYCVSGIAKLLGSQWRRGTALPDVLATEIYGSPRVGRLLRRHPATTRGLVWGLIAWEVSFPFVIIVPPRYAWLWLVMGIGFHVSSAVLMGLNTFLLTFVGTYPAILVIAGLTRSMAL